MEDTIFNSLIRERDEKQADLVAVAKTTTRLGNKREQTTNPMLHNAYTSAIHLIRHEMDEIEADIEILNQRISYMRGAV